MVEGIVRAIHRTVFYACVAGMMVIFLMMLLTTFDVIGRSFFNRPITGTYELSQYMLVIIALLGIAYVQQTDRYVRVTFFTDKLSLRGQLALDSIFTLVTLAVFSLMVWQGWEGGFYAAQVKSDSAVLHIPSYPFEFFIAVGAFLLSLELLLKLVTTVKNLKGPIADKELTG